MTPRGGVTFVVPVHNGAAWLGEVLANIVAQRTPRPIEIIAVDDGSADGSAAILGEACARDPRIRMLSGGGRGAAHAINVGIRHARYDLIAQIDQDVVLQPDWLERLAADLDDPSVAAAQGYYLAAADAGLSARVMNLDLEQRYAAIAGTDTGHVCTGNVIYRKSALLAIGLFDESLGYGYDNDVSYRLLAAGGRLTLNRAARAVHRWREGIGGYLRQQYGFGYGRLDLIAKFPSRASGDSVSPLPMMAHPVVMAATLLLTAAGAVRTAGMLLAVLLAERLAAGIAASRRFGDRRALWFPVFHAARDLAWVAAIAAWMARRCAGRPIQPSDSMRPRAAYAVSRGASAPGPKRPRA